jgi:type II secretory pathway pseudopilin PulG
LGAEGSTLPEILVSLMVFIPVAIVVVGLFPYAHTIDQRAWALGAAQGLAESQLEQARSEPINSVTNTSFHSLQRGLDFFVNVSVVPRDAQSLLVTSNVSWQFQRPQGYQLMTIIARMTPP